jgi:hypothetical protein
MAEGEQKAGLVDPKSAGIVVMGQNPDGKHYGNEVQTKGMDDNPTPRRG